MCSRYHNVNSSMESRLPNNSVGSGVGTGGGNAANMGEVCLTLTE